MEVQRTQSDIEKDEMLLKMQERMKAPLEWPSVDSCKILDLQEQHYDEVLRLIKRHYFKNDPMCASAGLLSDPDSVQCYVDLIRIWMRDTTSLVAISSKSGRIVGAAIARPNSQLDRSIPYSRMQIHEGEILKKIMDFKNTLVKSADVFNHFKHSDILRLYVFCVHPSYRARGLETALLEAVVEMAIALEMPVTAGLFTSGVTQQLALKLGFKVLTEIRYSRWIINDKTVFNNPGMGNYSAAFMGMLTPPVEYLVGIRRERECLKREEERRKRKH